MKIFLTGALGVNGLSVLRELLEAGDEILATDIATDQPLPADIAKNIHFEPLDVTDGEAVDTSVRNFKPDAIVHLAAIVSLDVPVALTYRVNALGTINILEAARRNSVGRVVYTSSRAVFGQFDGDFGPPNYRPVPETFRREAWPGAFGPYSASKIMSEDAGTQFAERYGFEFTALRFASIYGPGKTLRHGAVGVHSRIVEPAVRGESVTVARGGDQIDDMVYIKDIAQALRKAAHMKVAPKPAYNIGSGVGSTLTQFAEAVRKTLPDADIHIGGGLDHLGVVDRYGIFDNSAATRDFGYQPEYDLTSGVADYVKSLKEDALLS
jgi:UDP-glucose 4-epimerase